MLESTRQYASEKLDETGANSCRRRQAAYLLQLFERKDQTWSTTPTGPGSKPPSLNSRTCVPPWNGASAAGGDPGVAVTLFAFTGPYWIQLALQGEFRRWLKLAMANGADGLPPRIGGRVSLAHAQTGSPGDPVFIESALRAAALAARGREIRNSSAAHLRMPAICCGRAMTPRPIRTWSKPSGYCDLSAGPRRSPGCSTCWEARISFAATSRRVAGATPRQSKFRASSTTGWAMRRLLQSRGR